MTLDIHDRCEVCGRFVSNLAPGVSWSQTWSHGWDGPELHDPTYRCSPCTDAYGVRPTNCAPSYNGNGRNPPLPTATLRDLLEQENTNG